MAEQYPPNEYGGWQVNPTLDGDTLKQMMIDIAYLMKADINLLTQSH